MSQSNANGTIMDVTGLSFHLIGVSYKNADAELRGLFSLSQDQQMELLNQSKSNGISSLCVISTCNRTELFGFCFSSTDLIDLLMTYSNGHRAELEQVVYQFSDEEAVSHLFRVGTGLDSQILGDFEIISQLRNSFKRSKKLGMLNSFMERLGNSIIQASKRIKNETDISTGATSVSFAAVQYIMARVPYVSEKNILLFGIGKIGRNTCENLLKHTQNSHITLVNRTRIKAEEVAYKFNLKVKEYAHIQEELAQADILIVATGAQRPTINKTLLHLKKPLLILDLSIPKNVSPDVKENELVTLVHLDDLSRMTDRTLAKRKAQIPLAEEIITTSIHEFREWVKAREFAPTLKALKLKLQEMKSGEIENQRRKFENFNEAQADALSDRLIHKITTQFANHFKEASAPQEGMQWVQQIFKIEEPKQK